MTGNTGDAKQSASPYSTGGGGFTFEHRLGALLLTRMLTGGPVTALDDRSPQTVAFQQSPVALVDDLVVTALAADGVTTVRLDIAARRTPKFIQSHGTTGELVTTLVRADLAAERCDDPALEHRLLVAVSGRQTHAQEVADLARVARGQTNADDFNVLIRTPGKYSLGPRLDHLEAMVGAALDTIGDKDAGTKRHRTWRLLQRLRIWQVDVEEGHEEDWARLVADLTPVATGQTQEQGAALRDELARLSAQLAQTAGKLDGQALRRQLHGRLAPTRAASPGWSRLAALDEQSRATVTQTLASGGTNELLLPRRDARAALRAALETGSDLLIVGDSGVGKSALVMDAIRPDQLGQDRQALAMNLRHLPRTPADLLTVFDGPLEVLLGDLTAPDRTLVIDSAEAAAEEQADVLRSIALAARQASVRFVAVTTSEAAAAVREVVTSGGQAPIEHAVDGLDDAELVVVAEHFPGLQRLTSDARGRELLRRPIVVDLLSRAGDPGLPLSESQALEHIWSHLVRNQERPQNGMPDARQEVMLRLAEHAIRGGDTSVLLSSLDHEAVEGLRRSGLLQPASALPWERVPAFRHDLLRAYSIARLLLAEADPAAALSRFGAPRWTLPAARLACEILLSAPDDPAAPRAGRFERLQAGFDALAREGKVERWSEVPSEALLLAPDPKSIVEDAWPLLRQDQAAGLARLIRLVRVRHSRGGLIDPLAAAPLIAQLLEEGGTPKDVSKEATEVVTGWLQALVNAGTDVGNGLRVRLRDSILEQCRRKQQALTDRDTTRRAELAARTPEQVAADEEENRRYNIFGQVRSSRRKPVAHRAYEWINDEQIEHLSLLGPDLGSGGAAILRKIADEDPYKLEHAVETPFAGQSLASYDAGLLAELTLAYYIDEPEDEDGGFGWNAGLGDDGIRHHQFRGGPLNHFTYGPFLALLRTDYMRGVSVLNRMLDHAARCRDQILSSFERAGHRPEEPAIVLSVCGEPRKFAGDRHVWFWYRGTGVGPYPCMSGLQALELVTEQHIRAGATPQVLTTIMLKDAHSLAIPALALAILVRHLETSGEALDSFLVEPDVWQLEFGRATQEHSMLAAVIPDLVKMERRNWTLREVSMMLAITADGDRADKLRRLGERLEATARAQAGDDTSPAVTHYLAEVRQWASCLDRAKYQMTERDNMLVIELSSDPEVEQVLDEGNAELRRVHDALGLTTRHAHVRDNGRRAPDMDATSLAEDLILARELLNDLPEPRSLSVDGPVAAAASALELHLSGRVLVSDEDLLWSARVLLEVADEVGAGSGDDFDDSFFSQGVDRSAARALPFLLLPAAAPLRESLGVSSADDVATLVRRSCPVAVTGSNEARLAYARGLDTVWSQACDFTHLFGTCHHAIAFELATESFIRSRLGDWEVETQRRSVVDLEPPSAEGLASIEAGRIMVRRLTPALRAMGAAAASSACCATRADQSLRLLLDAHRRGMLAHDGYHHSQSDALVAARAALWQASAGSDDLVLEHIAGLHTNPRALAEGLQAVCAAADEQPNAARSARRLWPTVMDLVLDVAQPLGTFAERTWGDFADAALIPTPGSEAGYLTSELSEDPYRWRDLLSWKPQVERWLTMTEASRVALAHLVWAVRELDVLDQVRDGLRWIEQAVERAGNNCASTDSLPEWLRERRADLRDEVQVTRWQHVVDLLAVAGDTRVSDLAD